MVENQFNTNLPKYAEVTIKNIVATGKFKFKKFLSEKEINKIIEESYFGWFIVNQETSPQLCTYIIREDQSKIYLQLWHTGYFYMAGLRSEKELDNYFKTTLKELKRLVPGVFKEKKE